MPDLLRSLAYRELLALQLEEEDIFLFYLFRDKVGENKMSEIVVAKGGKATFSCELPDASYSGVWTKVSTRLNTVCT